MASADVRLKSDQPDRIWFAHQPLSAAIFALISLGFAWICWYFIRDDDVVRNVFVGFALLFVLVGVIGIFWRMELDIDLSRRRVRTVRGMWPAPKTHQRKLDDADGVWLTMEYRSSGSKGNRRRVPWWFVSLKFPGEKRGTRVFATRKEVEAYQKWEYYAERLRLDAVDATDGEPQRKAWRQLDDNLAVQSSGSDAGTARAPARPPDSAIEIRSNRGRKEIVLPASRFNAGLVFLVLFGGAFVALGGSALLASMGVLEIAVQDSAWAARIVPAVFTLAGIGIIWLGIKGSYTATILSVQDGALFTESLAFGKRSAKKSIPLADIESVGIGGDVRSRRRTGGYVRVGGVPLGWARDRKRDSEVVIRSDQSILRFGGALTEAEKRWLADVCRFATVRGQLP